MVDLCKIMMSVGIFLLFSKFSVVKGGWGGGGVGEGKTGGEGVKGHIFSNILFSALLEEES